MFNDIAFPYDLVSSILDASLTNEPFVKDVGLKLQVQKLLYLLKFTSIYSSIINSIITLLLFLFFLCFLYCYYFIFFLILEFNNTSILYLSRLYGTYGMISWILRELNISTSIVWQRANFKIFKNSMCQTRSGFWKIFLDNSK